MIDIAFSSQPSESIIEGGQNMNDHHGEKQKSKHVMNTKPFREKPLGARKGFHDVFGFGK
jgi:hypothetical protein